MNIPHSLTPSARCIVNYEYPKLYETSLGVDVGECTSRELGPILSQSLSSRPGSLAAAWQIYTEVFATLACLHSSVTKV